ncbi:type II toxin-antitoxin system antitoxin DNA ADP-ribosyl glycohydrolase DarG [Insolitispirillum peregrinum]|uniref:O-acetyl-ADP-ribose deacetylase (Regulator of RNase III), contains Macro domain n=1 Tax=Insolitispirillum peregrinum TaxID=80876 RepID=A0A1N7NLK9_9PROT|nr:macro domain-containing protein [Insolitispirillum peregrinum]SIS99254.1 O-acetyl-ADP-ribose deacetylase (regulator of RNase III), contains Macro domain [Insolitispirillum peregrinum]
MIQYVQGNLLDTQAEALVNTVNTVGVMGKGIALMFKERFPENFRLYASACKSGGVQVGKMFITEVNELGGPRWIFNFPTKQHWRTPSRMEWIVNGLQDLRAALIEKNIKSVAIPPLGAGNGGLRWEEVRPAIESALGDMPLDIMVFEPTQKYQNVAKRAGVEKLTPARALIAELVRSYWISGMECSLLEIQKLAWFLERMIEYYNPEDNPLNLHFTAHKYGPYANRLDKLLNNLDGSYLHCEKRISDASPQDVIWFDDSRREHLRVYLNSEAKAYLPALRATIDLINGFESPFGMELLSTVDWLLNRDGVADTVESIRAGLQHWKAGPEFARRKDKLFNDDALQIALQRLRSTIPSTAS